MSGVRPATLAEVNAAVLPELSRSCVPGAALGVLYDGLIESWGFGVANVETSQPVTAGTLFRLSSISKPFTATLVMQATEAGLVDLDAPVVHYLPDLRLADGAATARVTLRQLLSHTGGFVGEHWVHYGAGDDALDRALTDYRLLRQITTPGELWSYSNTGICLAAAVVQRVLGQPFEAAMRERVLIPQGMRRTFYFPTKRSRIPWR